MKHAGSQDHRKDRPGRESKRAGADGHQCDRRDSAQRARGIHHCAERNLADQPDETAHREHEADVDLRPLLAGQEDGDERPEAVWSGYRRRRTRASRGRGDSARKPPRHTGGPTGTCLGCMTPRFMASAQAAPSRWPAGVPGGDMAPEAAKEGPHRGWGRATHDDDGFAFLVDRRALRSCSRGRSAIRSSRGPLSGKCSTCQSTAILRVPTPRNPPKSMIAACTTPPRSTMTSTTRPRSSPLRCAPACRAGFEPNCLRRPRPAFR